jgi:hypothetical protein
MPCAAWCQERYAKKHCQNGGCSECTWCGGKLLPAPAVPAGGTAGECGEWPTVLILGTQKGATTSLASALTWQADFTSPEGYRKEDGPHCCSHAPHRKRCDQESHYFDFDGCHDEKCAAQYSGIFEKGHDGAIDADPGALYHVEMPRLLATAMPAALQPRLRLIAMLREGADRSLSWYNHRAAGTNVGPHFCGGVRGGVRDGVYHPSFAADSACELGRGQSETLGRGM